MISGEGCAQVSFPFQTPGSPLQAALGGSPQASSDASRESTKRRGTARREGEGVGRGDKVNQVLGGSAGSASVRISFKLTLFITFNYTCLSYRLLRTSAGGRRRGASLLSPYSCRPQAPASSKAAALLYDSRIEASLLSSFTGSPQQPLCVRWPAASCASVWATSFSSSLDAGVLLSDRSALALACAAAGLCAAGCSLIL